MISTILVYANTKERQQEAEKMLLEAGFKQNHPDLLWLGEEEKLGIEQVRQIQQFLSLKPYQARGHAVVLISADHLTLEAQNAFLKTLEESPEETLIILGASSEDVFLPTILSRCRISYPEKASSQQKNLSEKEALEIEKLLKSSLEERFVFVEKLKEKEEFLLNLIIYFRHKLLEKSLGVNTNPPPRWKAETIQSFLKDLLQAEKWKEQNISIRAILEHLMLKMP
ncbi:MAG: hypothetical protein Q7S44_01615 [bacterium]|nr:hypothetical protein [bacterium]